jgi:hypothetical protein
LIGAVAARGAYLHPFCSSKKGTLAACCLQQMTAEHSGGGRLQCSIYSRCSWRWMSETPPLQVHWQPGQLLCCVGLVRCVTAKATDTPSAHPAARDAGRAADVCAAPAGWQAAAAQARARANARARARACARTRARARARPGCASAARRRRAGRAAGRAACARARAAAAAVRVPGR